VCPGRISGYSACFNGLEIKGSPLEIDSARASTSLVLMLSSEISPSLLQGLVGVLNFASAQLRPVTTVKPAICFVRGLNSVGVAALYHVVVEDSKLDVEVPEIADGGTRV